MHYYFHIPFCKKKCPYCDFYSETLKDEKILHKYTNTLLNELDSAKNENLFDNQTKIESIYFGGGTPSLFPLESFTKIINYLKPDSNCEITIEINPESGKNLDFKKLKNIGINRLSIGIQAIDNSVLKKLGRIHTNLDVDILLEKIYNAGFKNNQLSFDFIIGNPTDNLETLNLNLDFIKTHYPGHISSYLLTIYEGTEYFKQLKNKKLILKNDDEQIDLYNYFKIELNKLGYNRYEISNYCLNNNYSKHNTNIWNFGDYLGFGAGAHSYCNKQRWFNPKLIDYFNLYEKISPKLKITKKEISYNDYKSEYIMLALRQSNGIYLNDFKKRFDSDFEIVFKDIIDKFTKLNLLKINEKIKTISLTAKGFDLYNSVVSEFM